MNFANICPTAEEATERAHRVLKALATPPEPKYQISITSYLSIGKTNAKTRKQLCDLTGHDDRTIRRMIEEARENGDVILSSSHVAGYWLPDNIDEVRQYVGEMRSRIRKLELAKMSAEKAIGEYVKVGVSNG